MGLATQEEAAGAEGNGVEKEGEGGARVKEYPGTYGMENQK